MGTPHVPAALSTRQHTGHTTGHHTGRPRLPLLAGLRNWLRANMRPLLSKQERAWRWTARGATNLARLEACRDRHRGRRCFIIGNGPSLNRLDLELLRDEYVIGTNRIMLHGSFAAMSRVYYCCVNPHVLEQNAHSIAGLGCATFLPWEHRRLLPEEPAGVLWLRTKHRPAFSYDLTDSIWQGATVTYAAMQVAFYLGFADVVLIGVDHHYERAGQPNKLVTSGGDDPDHFSPEYFGEGAQWQLPDLQQSETAYRLAKQAFEQEGRRIRDATAGGKLTVFEKTRYEDLF